MILIFSFLISGKSRFFKIEEKEPIKEIIPNIIFKEIENAGHSLHNSHKKEFLKEIMDFLE